MLKNMWLLLALIWPCAAQQPPAGENRIVSGTLAGDDGNLISGGFVTLRYQRIVPPGRLMRPLSRPTEHTTRSGSDGAFRFDNLLYGNYVLCAQVPRSSWLNSCDWGSNPIQVSVSEAPSATVTVVMRKGAAIPIRIDDPTRSLSQDQGRTPGAHLLLGVGGTDGLFRPAVFVSEDGGGRNYQTLVPFDLAIKMVASSSFFQMADGLGTPLQAQTTAIPLTVPARSTPPGIRFIVTGRRVQ